MAEGVFDSSDLNKHIETWGNDFLNGNDHNGEALFALEGFKWQYLFSKKQMAPILTFLCVATKPGCSYKTGVTYSYIIQYAKDTARNIAQRNFAEVFKALQGSDEFILTQTLIYDDAKVPAKHDACKGYFEDKDIPEIGRFLCLSTTSTIKKDDKGVEKKYAKMTFRVFWNEHENRPYEVTDENWPSAAIKIYGSDNLCYQIKSVFKNAIAPEVPDMPFAPGND